MENGNNDMFLPVDVTVDLYWYYVPNNVYAILVSQLYVNKWNI